MTQGEIWQLADARGVGGIERHVVELVGALGAHGIASRAVVYAPYRPSEYLDLLQASGTPRLELDGNVGGLLRALGAHRPALLHTHGYKAGIIGRLCARLLRVPVVSTFHAGERAPWPVGLYQSIDAATAGLGERVSVSEAIAARLPWRSHVIGNFVAPSREAVATLPRRVAFVGRLSPEKAPDLFCEIARRVGPGVQWDIYGDGPMRTALELVAPSFVRFHGFAADMNRVWPEIGLLLMPSLAEGLPMAALEAMARGIPVAASAVGALPDLLAPVRGDWTFPVGDIDAAVHAVEAWCALDAVPRSAALEQLRGELVDVVCRDYSPAAILPRLLSVYRAAGLQAAGSSSRMVQSSASSGAG